MVGERPHGCHKERPGGSCVAKALTAFLAFSAMLLLLIAVNGFSAQLALLFALMSAFFVAAVSILLKSNAGAYRKSRLADGMAEFFYRLGYYKSRKGSYFRAVDKAVQGTSAVDLREMVDRASKELKLGGSFLSGLAPREELGEGALLNNLRLSGADTLGQVRGALTAHELHMSERQSAMEESAQRYALVNMFISTIVPSFMVFAFIGTAILSQASVSLIPFSLSLVIFIPLSYAVGNSLLSRKMYA
jgi:hypothetical protein